MLPVIVLVGIYGGFVTVTEAAAIAAAASMVISLVFYKGFHWKQSLSVIAVGHWMTDSGVPAELVKWVLAHNLTTWEFLLTINVLLLVLGCFLEVVATLLLVLPILAPIVLL